MLSKPKSQRIAAILAFAGVVLPVSGLHKFYLGQQRWGIGYLLLSLAWVVNPIPRIASAIEGVWYLLQSPEEFDRNFNATLHLSGELAVSSVSTTAIPTAAIPTASAKVDPIQLGAIAETLRQLDQLRLDGLISEYEFEQKRRQLLDQIG